jgi:tetratricopeptide (TPR) repeat protein
VPVLPARAAQGDGRNAAGRQDPAEAKPVPREPRPVRGIQRRVRDRGTRGAGHREPWTLRRAPAGVCPGAAGAGETYQKLAAIDEQGASYTASGLGDLAIYEGRFADAERILERGATADLAAKNPDRAAAKFAALAYARVLRGAKGPALAAAEKALANSQAVRIRFLAARVFVETGATARAHTLSVGLGGELQAEPQAYAKIVEGETTLKGGNPREAIKTLGEANALFDTWLGHFALGRAYLEAGAFTQADSEFDRCLKRRGEAVSLFLDEEPTYGYFPPAYYYQGRVRQALNSARFAESYRTYLTIRGQSKEDLLLPDVRRRVGK